MIDETNKIIAERKTQSVLHLLTEIGEMMITSGAHTARIIRNLERIAIGLGYHCELVLTYTGIVISVYEQNKFKAHTLVKTIKSKGLNFETVSEISILSWHVFENKISIEEIQSKLEQIKNKKVYSELQLYALAPFASVALCLLFDGDWIQSIIVYFSTLFGFYARRSMMLKHHNHMIAFFIGATISTLFIHLIGVVFNIEIKEAMVVSVLYLIPGAVMINAFIDYLEGYFESGTARLIYSFMLVLMIAFGFYTSTLLFENSAMNKLNLFDFSAFQTYIKELLQPKGWGIELSKFIFGGICSVGFALMFNTPKRALWTVFILGAIGYFIKFILFSELDVNLILSIFIASCFVGISGINFAHRAHTPPIIFMIPAVINMIPGLISYEFMMGMINWIGDPKENKPSVEDIIQTFSYGVSTLFILFALAFGVAFPVVAFKSHSVKGKDLNVLIKRLFSKNS